MTSAPPSRLELLTTLREPIVRWIEGQALSRGATGVQVAVGYRGELVWEHAWGLANVETGEALTTDHLFRIASHSKTFTAVAIMQLVESGELRLDDRAAAHVPELAGTPIGTATVRELLGHQAGTIRDSSDGDFWQHAFPFPDRAELLRILREEGRVFAANQHFKYSNIGYGLLGLIIEAVTGESYDAATRRLIVEPLGLSDTGSEYDPARAADYAAGHTARLAAGQPRAVIPHVDTRALASATGWYANARDLVRYGGAHVFGDETLLSDASKRVLQREESRFTPRDRPEARYGLGLDLSKIADREVVGHSGGYPGHITRTWIDPIDGLVVTVLTNDLDGLAGPLAAGVLQLITLATRAADAGEKTPDELRFTGRFAGAWGAYDIVDLGGTLHALSLRAPDPFSGASRLVPRDGRLVLEEEPSFAEAGEPVTVTRGADGAIESIRLGAMTAWPIDRFDLTRPHVPFLGA
ncbi:serine hydrolase domain-containing protein [Microbacterium sediminis]|uniref:serine hydrolase domain-containing protein n=1 Tax=Microbacterium sediminis TaxID=904291 RepID=UPI0010722D82|nr:serine hydrolase domain-containing protein [Microbacterium sediminis]QBR73504.1 class A beta-lactamase-related serine hydrolase [Microbacterium sediminis]